MGAGSPPHGSDTPVSRHHPVTPCPGIVSPLPVRFQGTADCFLATRCQRLPARFGTAWGWGEDLVRAPPLGRKLWGRAGAPRELR